MHGSTGRQQSRLSWQREKTELFRPQNHAVNRKTLGGNDFRVFEPKEQRGGDIHARSHRGGMPHGYELAVQKDGSVTIRLPLRLSKRSSSTEFVCEPLNWLLARWASALSRFRACTVVFYHCYAASHQHADVRDHDNLETRAVLNVIERYLPTSDSGIYCSNVQTSCWSDRDQTVICIRPGKIPVFDLGAEKRTPVHSGT